MIPRLTAPTSNDKYWNNNVSPCIDGSPQAWKGSTLSNCVGYVWGRTAEINGKVDGLMNPGGALHFYTTFMPKWERGQKAREGAIGVWVRDDNKIGHVMICEILNPDGSIVVSGSDYGGKAFYTKTLKKDYFLLSGWKFKGWIYNPNVVEKPFPNVVEKDHSKHQFEVTYCNVNWRSGPGTTYKPYGVYVKEGIYDVLDTKDDGKYVWIKAGEDFWFASYGNDYPAEDEKDKKIKELEEKLEKIKELCA